MKGSILSLFTLITIIYGCSAKEAEGNNVNRLHDIWALESIGGVKIFIDETVKNLPVIEVYVNEKRIHGNTSCNTIDGKVEIDKNNIKFSEIITTEMACPGDIEQRFLSALSNVNNYKIEKLRLYLFENEKELLTLRKID
jgi:heat shock protein HslJ